MYYSVSKDAHEFIESAQKSVISKIGADPNELLGKAQKNGSIPISYGGERFTPDQLEKLKEAYKNYTINDFYTSMPEYHYDTSFEYFKFMHCPNVTDFDNPRFLGRFCNLIPLCHRVFTRGGLEEKQNIIISSLHALNLNGISLKYDKGTKIIFLNEGLLSILPKIYQNMMPGLDQSLFGKKNGNWLGIVVEIITSSQFYKKSFSNMHKNANVRKAHAHEKWYFRELINRNQIKNMDSSELDGHPRNLPFSQKMAQFYACRGAYIFLLGHEFSHAYNDHFYIRNLDGANLRAPDFFDNLDDEIILELKKYPSLSPSNDNFNINQATEEEADAHGFLCVQQYCFDNKLDDQRLLCVLSGAIGALMIIEIFDLLTKIRCWGSKNTKEFYDVNPFVRNMIFGIEHPTASTRIEMALMHKDIREAPIKQLLSDINNLHIDKCNYFKEAILEFSDKLEDELVQSEKLDIDFTSIFSPDWSVGAASLSNEQNEALELFLGNRKRKSNVVDIFSRR